MAPRPKAGKWNIPARGRNVPDRGKTTVTPRRNYWPFFLAGGALLLIIAGLIAVWRPAGQISSAGGTSPIGGNPTQVADKPRLAVDRQQIDFGRVPLDRTVKATFVLSNVGDRPLQIVGEPVIEVKKGC
jgi:hypothetical protein